MWKIIIFFEIILCVLCIDYILHIRKIYKIDRENLNDKILKLSENKEKGERFFKCIRNNVCSNSIRYVRK